MAEFTQDQILEIKKIIGNQYKMKGLNWKIVQSIPSIVEKNTLYFLQSSIAPKRFELYHSDKDGDLAKLDGYKQNEINSFLNTINQNIDKKINKTSISNEIQSDSQETVASSKAVNDLRKQTLSGVKGVATQSNAPTPYSEETHPDGLFERYVVSAPLTSPNSWGNIDVIQAELDDNYVFFNVTNGMVSKELSAKTIADPAKLPLYSAIKSANIAAGTQFIDDENGNIIYRVKAGQTLLPTELPSNTDRTEKQSPPDKQFEAGIDISGEVSKQDGFYINTSDNGKKDPVAGYSATEFINISDVNYFEVNPNNYHQFAYYTKEKTFLSGALFATKKVKKPKGAYYVRFTLKNDEVFLLKLFRNAEIENVQNKLSLDFSNNGYYVNATNGSKKSLSFYSYSDFIPVKAGDVVRYKINGGTAQPKHLTFFGANQHYLGGNTDSEINTVSQDGFIVFSTETALFGKTVLTINNADLSLKNGNPLLLQRKNLKGFAMVNFCTVSKDGGGDFKTINEAVEFGKNLGTENEKFIIYLMSGIYIEHVNIAPYHINIIGFDREKCIIQINNGDYHNVPLNVSGRNSGANFTAYATNSEGNTPTIWAYGMHCDSSGEGRSVWNNCTFLSTVNAGVGLGTQNNQQYEFINCRIENLGTNYDGGGFYSHNSPYPNHKKMSVWVENCVISTKLTKSVIIDDANANAGHNDDDGTIFTFINNNCWSEINGKNANSIQFSNVPTTGDIGQIKIGLRSFGNNVTKLNK